MTPFRNSCVPHCNTEPEDRNQYPIRRLHKDRYKFRYKKNNKQQLRTQLRKIIKNEAILHYKATLEYIPEI